MWTDRPGTASSTLDDLDDVDVSGVSNGQVIVYVDGTWVPATVDVPTVLDDLADVDGGGTAGQILTRTVAGWSPADLDFPDPLPDPVPYQPSPTVETLRDALVELGLMLAGSQALTTEAGVLLTTETGVVLTTEGP